MEKTKIQNKLKCINCGKELKGNHMKYCSLKCSQKDYHIRFYAKFKKNKDEYVKIPSCGLGNRTEYVYCNGMSKTIQKQIPELMNKAMIKLLNEEVNMPFSNKKLCLFRQSRFCTNIQNPNINYNNTKRTYCNFKKDVCPYLKNEQSEEKVV